ncbi:polyamine ABC transporter substrate-binding protein [Aestuariivirga sp.]|uniref:polyamine ABC transporter substrate-binding protein n=1 Tax=Aestuariivirga sp. TaxID=2650926 RepID=UPI0039E3FC43
MKLTRRSALLSAGAAVALGMPYVRRAKADDAVVNVYNWADYIGETTLEDFQKATGISVTYDTYSSSEEMQAKMLAGSTGYDAVIQAGLDMPRFIKAGVYDKLDKSKLPGWKNLDPEVLRILSGWDAGNEYGIPYMWGSVGFTFNVDMVKQRIPDADMSSLDLIFKPENAAKLADCGISILDSPSDIVPAVLRYLGKDGDTTNVADYDAVVAAFKPIRKYIKTFDNTNYLNAIPNKELCVVNDWSGDYATAKSRAKDAGVDINLAYFVPKTGAPAWVDNWCIPKDAPHKENAYKFLDYMLQPEVIAKCTNFTNYANGNLASKPFVDPAVLADPAVYPDAETISRMWAPKPYNEEQDRAITKAWQTIKSG